VSEKDAKAFAEQMAKPDLIFVTAENEEKLLASGRIRRKPADGGAGENG
jgi:hypothetical protein